MRWIQEKKQYLRPSSAMSGGSGPQGMQIIRPIIIRKKPPHSMTRLSSNLDQKIGYTKKKVLLQYGSLDAKIAYIFFFLDTFKW